MKILGVTITNEKKKIVLEYLFNRLDNVREKTFISTPNPEMLVYAKKHLDYQNKLNSSTIALPDGIGLFFASLVLGESLKERIPGVDFIEDICRESLNKPLSIGFLGGKEGVAEEAAERLLKRYPYLQIVFTGSEWPKDERLKIKDVRMKKDGDKIFNPKSKFVNPSQIDILFVAYGVPKQEEWIYENLGKLPIKAAMGVGGAFDFLSGQVSRAPQKLRLLGLEWLYRLIIQPWRWKRQLALMEFVYLVFKEKFSK